MKTLTKQTSKSTQLYREVLTIAQDLGIDPRELLENIEVSNRDFEVDNYRFIEEAFAEDILISIYECDTYILGCFNSWFISDCCNIDSEVVEALQKAEAHSALGNLMLKNGIEELISEYVRLDGYGHAFVSYDGNHEETSINGVDFIYFRTN